MYICFMLGYLLALIAIVGCSLAAFFDLKTTEIPDKVPASMLILGISIRFLYSLFSGNWMFLETAIIVSGLLFGLGFAMYYLGQWGGGDAKILGAVGSLLPTLPSGFHPYLFFPFSVSFLINLFFIGAIYIILYALGMSLVNPDIANYFIKDVKGKWKSMSAFIFILLGFVISATYILSLNFGTRLNLMPVLYLVGGIAGLFLLWNYLKVVENKGFRKRIKTENLKEGDMLGEDLPSLNLSQKLIRGLTKQEVETIKMHRKNLIIKEGVRFGPVFPIALLITLFVGDFLILLI